MNILIKTSAHTMQTFKIVDEFERIVKSRNPTQLNNETFQVKDSNNLIPGEAAAAAAAGGACG